MNSKVTIVLFLVNLASLALCNERASLFLNQQEAKEINESLDLYPILKKSFHKTETEINNVMARPIEVPQPGEGGGYEHERHKQNYRDMRNAGIIFRITGEEKYALFVWDMLRSYAKMYPKLGPHPFASSRRIPSKLFHQALNEAVWLVYTSQAYDCIYDWLNESDRENLEKNLFRPMLKWFSVDNERDLNRIHNHGTWAVAAVGMMAYLLDDRDLVEKCLYGTKKDGKGGFLNQLDLLFSPDGYYMEGLYYARYALRPFFFFAEAIERFQPELKIYEYRNQILKKAFYATAQSVFPNGIFPPINDASRSMNITAPGPLFAHNYTYHRYSADQNLLAISQIQDEVILNSAGLAVAKDYSKLSKSPELNWGSIELTDGFDGKQGGLGILRHGKGINETMLLMKYGVQGKGHGHFDKLHFILFEQGREVVPDYGFGRWINIEPKFGGRYLPENDSYAKQTIAHNTVVVDQVTQSGFNWREAEKVSGKRHFFDASSERVQVMSARANDYYPGVLMQRTMFLIKEDRLDLPIVVDLYSLKSSEEHVYDYPLHFRGQLITTNFEYKANSAELVPLGTDYGYQHIWNEATAMNDSLTQVTWLDGQRYYTFTTSSSSGTEILFGRTGANDPNFNLVVEPMVIIRRKAKKHLFASVIEPHGYFNEAQEQSRNARSNITGCEVIHHDENYSVVKIKGNNNFNALLMVNNGKASNAKKNKLKISGKEYNWTGNYQVVF